MKNKEDDSSMKSAKSGHDPLSFVTDLGAKLATRSRHVCVLLGAGAANACGLPDVGGIEKRILEKLEAEDKDAFELQLSERNLEEALSRIRRISALLGSGKDTVDGLTAEKAKKLDNAVCRTIVEALRIKNAEDLSPVDCLAAWVARANYHQPVELFTLNYDLLLETALEKRRAPYFDGFVGTLEARFDTELSEAPSGPNTESMPAFFARLWKLHGSVNWAWNDDREIVRLGYEVPGNRAAAIYPSDAKYEESRRVPFVVLQDIFRKTLHQPETLVMITGYSFGDDHINEQLFHAAARRQRSEFIVFCFGEIPEKLAERASITPNLQVVSGSEAILGGSRADWKPPESEDLPENSPVTIWDLESEKFALCDFRNLAAYLARSTTVESDGIDTAIKDLLNEVVEKSKKDDN